MQKQNNYQKAVKGISEKWKKHALLACYENAICYISHWRQSGMIFLRSLWQGLSRTFIRDCIHAWTRLADTVTLNI